MKKITKAILPVAGLGTRFLPATKAQPKEMLAIYDKPAIQYIVEEAVGAGITDIIIVTGRLKRAIEDHFDTTVELEQILESQKKFSELEQIRSIASLARFAYVRQPKPMGDGHAILCADHLIEKDEDIVVLFGDDLVDNGKKENAVEQLIEAHQKVDGPIVGLFSAEKDHLARYGVVSLESIEKNFGRITHLVEKPKSGEEPSNLCVVGKYILTSEIRKILKNLPEQTGEIRLSDAFSIFLQNGGNLYGRILDGARFDTGDKNGFLEATLHYAFQKGGDVALEIIKNFSKKF